LFGAANARSGANSEVHINYREVFYEALVVSSYAQRADAARPRPRNLRPLPTGLEGIMTYDAGTLMELERLADKLEAKGKKPLAVAALRDFCAIKRAAGVRAVMAPGMAPPHFAIHLPRYLVERPRFPGTWRKRKL
jgi:hypothetical protein